MESIVHDLANSFKDSNGAKACLHLLRIYVKNIVENPSSEKYRKIRTTNPKFSSVIWCHKEARTFIFSLGFEQDGEMLLLPASIRLDEVFGLLNAEFATLDTDQGGIDQPSTQKVNCSSNNASIAPHLKLAVANSTGKSIFGTDIKPDMTLLSYLTEMGYRKDMASKALISTGNKGVQPAMDWIDAHLEELLSSEPLKEAQDSSPEGSYSNVDYPSSSNDVDESHQRVPISRYQKVAQQRHQYQEKQRHEAIAAAREAKRAEKKHKEYLLKNMHMERNFANEKFEQQKLARQDCNSTTNPDHAQQDHSESISETEVTLPHHDDVQGQSARIRVRLINEKDYNITMELAASVDELYRNVAETTSLSIDDFILSTPVPPSDLTNLSASIRDAGLYPSATLMMKLKNSEINPFQPRNESEHGKDEATESAVNIV